MQERPGYKGRPFNIIKFKTMNERKDSNGNMLPDIQRITKFGAFVRNTSIDELPQLINVFVGNMSLIGNRPYLPREKEDMGDSFYEIVKSKPGITGYWQVSGKENSTFEKRLELEKYYSNHMSLGVDIKIFFGTFKAVFCGHGADE